MIRLMRGVVKTDSENLVHITLLFTVCVFAQHVLTQSSWHRTCHSSLVESFEFLGVFMRSEHVSAK